MIEQVRIIDGYSYELALKSERKAFVEHLQGRIDGHWGCRGAKSCAQCTGYKQLIGFVNSRNN
jgi:hypothetical protein